MHVRRIIQSAVFNIAGSVLFDPGVWVLPEKPFVTCANRLVIDTVSEYLSLGLCRLFHVYTRKICRRVPHRLVIIGQQFVQPS
jgi:hypothetical protein